MRAPARPPSSHSREPGTVVSLEIPGIVVSLEIPVFRIFLVKIDFFIVKSIPQGSTQGAAVSLEIPGIVVSLEIPVFWIFSREKSVKIVKIDFSDSWDQHKILIFL